MAEPYNHRAIEQKWRDKWEATPINVNDGKKPKYYCLETTRLPRVLPRCCRQCRL